MYRCKECNAEFKIKPDYCDCGNDTFDYIEEKHPITLEEKSEIVSRVFFAICLLIAIGVWFIPMGKKTSEHKQVTKTKPVAAIPNINKIWDDTPIYQPKPEQPARTEPIILTPTKPVQKKNIINQPVQTKPSETPTPKPKPAPAKPVVTPKPVTKSEPIVKLEPAKPVYNPNSPAMIDYKTKLRAKLFSKFAVGSIQGSGSCSISFSVDKSGKLINRKFTKESDNKSLNDTVYYMLMSVPYFTAPPAEYNGETIRMNFSINNGNYEISIN